MKNKLLTLATVAGLALLAGQASAITTSTSGDAGKASVSAAGAENSFFWSVSSVDSVATNAVTFENTNTQTYRASFSWSVQSFPFGTEAKFELRVLNGGNTLLSVSTPPSAGGFGTFLIPVGKQLTFQITGTEGGAGASGQVAFAPIPLPAGILLLLTALGGLAATRKISKKPEMA